MEKALFRLRLAETGSIRLTDLSEYLGLLNAFYDSFRADLYRSGEYFEAEAGQDATAAKIVDYDFDALFYDSADSLAPLARDAQRFLAVPFNDKPYDAAVVRRIKHESPMDIWISAIPIALSFAAILSGGKIEMPGFKVSLPPLGTGVLALRRALGYAVENPPTREQPQSISEAELVQVRAKEADTPSSRISKRRRTSSGRNPRSHND
jgi:hypothetical protein